MLSPIKKMQPQSKRLQITLTILALAIVAIFGYTLIMDQTNENGPIMNEHESLLSPNVRRLLISKRQLAETSNSEEEEYPHEIKYPHEGEKPSKPSKPKGKKGKKGGVTQAMRMRPKVFIFGYGSIINSASRVGTGGKDIGNAIPVRVKPSAGLQRVWNFQKPTVAKLTALGLENAPGSYFTDGRGDRLNAEQEKRWPKNDKYSKGHGRTINGVIYPVYDNIENFDKREEGYFRLRLRTSQLEALSWQNLPAYKDAEIYAYALNKENQAQRPTFNLPILQTYVDVVINGCLEYGVPFAEEFVRTTGGWSEWWLNDRQIPRRPWLKQGNFKKIDKLLKKAGLKGAHLSESYVTRFVTSLQLPQSPLLATKVKKVNSKKGKKGKKAKGKKRV